MLQLGRAMNVFPFSRLDTSLVAAPRNKNSVPNSTADLILFSQRKEPENAGIVTLGIWDAPDAQYLDLAPPELCTIMAPHSSKGG